MRIRGRDSQRSRLYAAESEVQTSAGAPLIYARRYTTRGDATGGRLETLAELQAYCDAVTGSAWYRRHFPYAPRRIIAEHGGGRRAARAGYRTIKMPTWSRSRFVVLHEIAHCVAGESPPSQPGYFGGGPHGRWYAKVYLDLVQHHLGEEFARRLRQAFRKHKVKWHPKRKGRPGNPAALEAYRAAKEAGLTVTP